MKIEYLSVPERINVLLVIWSVYVCESSETRFSYLKIKMLPFFQEITPISPGALYLISTGFKYIKLFNYSSYGEPVTLHILFTYMQHNIKISKRHAEHYSYKVMW